MPFLTSVCLFVGHAVAAPWPRRHPLVETPRCQIGICA
nr:MAG TPA: hypothetical protein [Caudoviricetes sp.]